MSDEKEQESPSADEETSEATDDEATTSEESPQESSEADQQVADSTDVDETEEADDGETSDEEAASDQGEEASEESGDSAGVGGVFDVAESSRSTKGEKEDATDEEDEGDEENERDKTKRKSSTQSDLDDLAGVLGPSSGGSGSSSGSQAGGGPDDDYLLEDDLDVYGESGSGGKKVALVLAILVALGAVGFVVVQYTALGGDLVALAQGELRDRRMAEAQQEKREFERKQEEEMPKFGVLNLTGTPRYAELELNGEVQYGQVESGAWRALRLDQSTTFQNIPVKEEHTIEANAPGFKKDEVTVTEGTWESGDSPTGYTKNINFKLVPESFEQQLEFEQRMDTKASAASDEEYNGEVTITTEPEGARVIFNNETLVDEDGEELTTPVTFDKYYVEDEDDEDELEEKDINVSTPPDRGHKIELEMPESEGDYPEFITMLDRRMWYCEWEDGEAPEDIPDDESYRDYCNYTFELDFNFDELEEYIERREKEKERVEKQNEELQAAQEEREKQKQKEKQEETELD